MTPVNIILAVAGTQGVLNALDSVRGSLSGIASTALGASLGIGGLAVSLTDTIKRGVAFNATLEQAQLGIAAVLKQFDDKGRFKNFNDAIQESGEAIEQLKAKAVESPAAFSDLVQAFQGTVGPMTAANIKLRDQVNLIVNMSQALAGLGIRSEQILQETRALITGNINADAAAAKILGITAQDVAQAKAKGQLYEFLASKIAAFAEAGERGAQSLTTLQSNLGDAAEQRAAAATEGLNEALKGMYRQLTVLVNSKEFQEFIRVFADKASGIVSGLTTAANALSSLPLAAIGRTGLTIGEVLTTALAARLVYKLDTKLLEWATSPTTSAAGTAFASTFLAPVMSGLTKVIPYLLAAVIGYQVGRSIGDAINRWRQIPVDEARQGNTNVESALNQAGAIGSEADRAAALERIKALENDIVAARTAEESKVISSNSALGIYDQQLASLRSMMAALNSDWAQHQILLNKAADAAAQVAKSEAIAKAWLAGDNTTLAKLVTDPKQLDKLVEFSAEKLRDIVAKSAIDLRAQTNPEAALADAQAFLGVMDRTLAIYKAERDAGRNTAENQKNILETSARRATTLATIATLEEFIARRTSEQAQTELNRSIRAIERQRSLTEGNIGLTEAQKWPERKRLLEDEIAAQQRYLDVLQNRLQATKDIAARETLLAQINGGLDRLSGLYGQQAQLGADPSSFSEQMIAANTAAQNSIGTTAQMLARTWSTSADSMRTSMGTAFGDMLLVSGSASDKMKAAGWTVEQAFARNGAQMVADWLYQHTVLAAVHAIFQTEATAQTAAGAAARTTVRAGEATTDVALTGAQTAAHAAGEATKTGWTLLGSIKRGVIRLGETLFHAGQVALRVIVHLAGETAQTAITLVQTAIRIPAILAESLVYIAKAAAGAMSAMASIPYVGPFLAIGAMAAILAAGSKLVSGAVHREKGGTVTGGEQLVWMNESGEEFVWSAPAVRAIGEDRLTAMHEAARNGDLSSFSQAAAPATGSASSSGGSAATDGPKIYNAFFNDELSARQWLATKTGQRNLIRSKNNNNAAWGSLG